MLSVRRKKLKKYYVFNFVEYIYVSKWQKSLTGDYSFMIYFAAEQLEDFPREFLK